MGIPTFVRVCWIRYPIGPWTGGGTDAGNTKIRASNSMTWAGVNTVSGKPILADTGYGAAGASAGEDAAPTRRDIVRNY